MGLVCDACCVLAAAFVMGPGWSRLATARSPLRRPYHLRVRRPQRRVLARRCDWTGQLDTLGRESHHPPRPGGPGRWREAGDLTEGAGSPARRHACSRVATNLELCRKTAATYPASD